MNARMKSRSLFLSLALSLSVTFFCTCKSPDKQSEPDGRRPKEVRSGKAAAVKERPLPDTILAAFYNVENLFDFNLDGTEYNEYKPGWYGWTEENQRKKLAGTADVVAAIGADILGLCEVENLNVLKELQNELDKRGIAYPYAVVGDAPKSATVTALLSKLPIREKFEYPVAGFRSILEARVARGGDEVAVFVNHWPSKRHQESKRLEAAQILKTRLDELPPGLDYMVMGDFNANHDEFATLHTAGFNNTGGRTGINHVLKTVLGGGAGGQERFVCKGELADCGECHYTLWLELPEEERRSYVYRGAAQTIDNILLPRSMFDGAGYSYLDGSFDVFTWDGALLKEGVPYRWQMVFKGKQRYHTGSGYSDHLPIKASFVKVSIGRDSGSYGDDGNNSSDSNGNNDNNDNNDNSNSNSNNDNNNSNCEIVDPRFTIGDFETTVDGWMSGDSRFVVTRDKQRPQNGSYSLRVIGKHDTENRTAARVKLQTRGGERFLTMSVRGSGNISIRLRRPDGKWAYFNGPDFAQSKSAKYKNWSSGSWVKLKLPIPPAVSGSTDLDAEIRAGKGEPLSLWVDGVRVE